ncbi:Secondary metabolism regulator LAE1 [Fusarium oxysporum f. sp. albedinis]|nr:Secondary metabolism regulator LAE1 [Fusarium oxysporum f. sp. albedinis]
METNQRFQTLAVSYKQLATERNWSPTSQQLKVMILLSALAFLVALDSCIIVTALHGIAVDLHLTANESFWVGTSFLLSNAVTMPLISGAGSVFGHARPLTASVLTFTAGTVFCCLAHSSPPLLIGRILQGIGAGGIMSLTLMIYADIVPLRHRPKWYGIVLASWAGGNCTGPVLGGLIVQKTTWSDAVSDFHLLGRRSVRVEQQRHPDSPFLGHCWPCLDLLYGQLYYIPFYFTSLKAYSPIKTGLATLPVMLITVPSSVIAGGFVTRTKNYRLPIWLGWMLTATGSGLTLLFDASTPTAQWAAVLVVIGFGHGAVLNAQNFACQAMCNSGDEILAAAMYAFTRQFGMALGVGIGGSTFQNAMSIKLRQLNLPTEIAKNSEAYVVELHKLPDGAMMKQRIFDAYAFGFRGVFLFFTCVSGFGFLLSLVIKHFDMDRQTEEQRESDEIVRLARLHNISPPIRQYSEAGPFDSKSNDISRKTNSIQHTKYPDHITRGAFDLII